MPRKKRHPTTHPGFTPLNSYVCIPTPLPSSKYRSSSASIKLLSYLHPDSTLLLTNWGACRARLGDEDDEKEREEREIEVLVELQRRVKDRLESSVCLREIEEIAKGWAADSETGERLDVQKHGGDRKSLEVEGEKIRVGKREISNSEDEDEDENEEDVVTTPKAKRRKVSDQQFTPAITNQLCYSDHLSSKIKANLQGDDNLTVRNHTTNANANVDEEISDAESDLTIVSNITELAPTELAFTPKKKPLPQLALSPARIHQTHSQVSTPTTPLFTSIARVFNSDELISDSVATEEQDWDLGVLDPHRSYLHHALNTLEFEEGKDCPAWITGLRKPIRHAGLTDVQNLEIKIRMWDDEIERLVSIRNSLPILDFEDSDTDSDSTQNVRVERRAKKGKDKGEWSYSHWTYTQEVQLGRSKKRVVARGVWKWAVGKEVQGMLFDEWPRDVWGEPLGWAVRMGQGENNGDEEEDEDSAEESEDEEIWDEMIRGMGDGMNEAKESTDEVEVEKVAENEMKGKSCLSMSLPACRRLSRLL